MNLVVTHEKRFQVDKDGNVYTDNENSTGYYFFRRYLDVFDSVTVIGRAHCGVTTANAPVTGPGVTFHSLPFFWGAGQYVRKSLAIKKEIRSFCAEAKKNSAFIARCPSVFGGLLAKELIRSDFPYAVEVVSDPFEVYSPGSIKHPLRPILRILSPINLKKYCSNACAVSYVTQSTLQKRYPAATDAFMTHYSSIRMKGTYLVNNPRLYEDKIKPLSMITVCTLEQLYKGTDTLIDAVAACRQMGADVYLTIVGDGRFRSYLEKQVVCKGIDDRVSFLGRLNAGDAVKKQLDLADLFVLPSKGEGLPRAMIEAMARALPCLGTNASGIPELLSPEEMVPVGDAVGLAQKISNLYHHPGRMNQMSRRNLEKAKDYIDDTLKDRRNAFYKYVKEISDRKILANSQCRNNIAL